MIYVLTDGVGHFRVGISSPTAFDGTVTRLQHGNAFRLRLKYQRIFPQDIGASVKEMVSAVLEPHRVRGEWYRTKEQTIIDTVDAAVNKLHRPQQDTAEALAELRTVVQMRQAMSQAE